MRAGVSTRRSRGVAALLAAALLAACGSAPPQTFDLSAVADVQAQTARRRLVVNEPEAVLPADSDRIVVRTGPEAVAYLSGAQWADRLPKLLQSRLIQTFENAHLSRAVSRPGAPADVVLSGEIRRFEIDVVTREAVVEWSVRLVADASGKVVAARVFSARNPIPVSGPAAMAAALDAALGGVLRQIVAWAARPD